MNKKITISLAGLAITAALAGCKSSPGAAASEASVRAHATSTTARQAETAGKDALSTCIPAKDLTESYFVGLAVHKSQAEALAKKCDIPKANVTPFVQAVITSAANAYFKGTFKTAAGRTDWADKVFPVILSTYQAKK
jgi:hypothetical protein